MKKFLISFLTLTTLIGCSDREDVNYNDSQAYVAFQNNVYDLKIPLNSTKVLDAVLEASNKVDFDRTYQVEIVPTETDANPATYVLPATVTIPANSFTGILSIVGSDLGLVDSNIKKLTLKLTALKENESTDSSTVVINILEFCPVIVDEFVGDFLSNTWWLDGESVQVISEGTAPNTLVIEDFYSTDLVITYDPENNNRINFTTMYTGQSIAEGPIWARISTTDESNVDACTGKVGIWIQYYIKDTNLIFGPPFYEVWTKL